MTGLVRFTVSIEQQLLDQFDQYIATKGYTNRSEAVRDLMRSALVEQEWNLGQGDQVATVTLVYDHHVRDLADRLAAVQHDHFECVVSTLHVHLSHDLCLEVLVLRGEAAAIKLLAESLLAIKGVQHGKIVFTGPGAVTHSSP